LFCQNYMDAKLVCQTVGVALTKPDPCMHNVTDEENALADMEHG
jgi:hypothetical protein